MVQNEEGFNKIQAMITYITVIVLNIGTEGSRENVTLPRNECLQNRPENSLNLLLDSKIILFRITDT